MLIGLSMAIVLMGVLLAAPWSTFFGLPPIGLLQKFPGSFFDKQQLGVFRLIHFAACAHLAAVYLPARCPGGWAVDPIAAVGRNALATFGLSTLLSAVATASVAQTGGGLASHAVVTVGGLAILALFGTFLDRGRRLIRDARAIAAPAPE
jgi:hypothetical protein